MNDWEWINFSQFLADILPNRHILLDQPTRQAIELEGFIQFEWTSIIRVRLAIAEHSTQSWGLLLSFLLQVIDLNGGECILDFGNRGAIDCVASSVAEDEGVPTDVQLLRVTRGDRRKWPHALHLVRAHDQAIDCKRARLD